MRDVDINALYDKELNTWIRKEKDLYIVGVTNWAQEFIGDINSISDLPRVGQKLKKQMVILLVESNKSSTEVLSPISGQVLVINNLILSKPSLINSDSYGDGWIIMVRRDHGDGDENFMSVKDYQNSIASFFNKE